MGSMPLTSCMHKVEKAYQTQDIDQVALFWDMTENVRTKHSKKVLMYSRTGNAWYLDGKYGRGYYDSRGMTVHNPKGDIVTYFAEQDLFKFIHNGGSCREIYSFKFNENPTISILLSNECNVYGTLDQQLTRSLKIDSLDEEDQRKVEKRINQLMSREIELTSWSR